MTHYWILEADSPLELEKEINWELTTGGELQGRSFVSPSHKYYQAITREVSPQQILEPLDLASLQIFQIN